MTDKASKRIVEDKQEYYESGDSDTVSSYTEPTEDGQEVVSKRLLDSSLSALINQL